jgi:hypothetical protein
LEVFDDEAALIEFVGPDGRTLDALFVQLDNLDVVESAGSQHDADAGRLAG